MTRTQKAKAAAAAEFLKSIDTTLKVDPKVVASLVEKHKLSSPTALVQAFEQLTGHGPLSYIAIKTNPALAHLL